MVEDIEKLRTATALVIVERNVQGAAWIFALFGIALIGSAAILGFASVREWALAVVGISLLAEAGYIRFAGSPKVLLAAFGSWHLLISYRGYRLLMEQADPEANQRVRTILAKMQVKEPENEPGMIEWTTQSFEGTGLGLMVDVNIWRMRAEGDLLIMAKLEERIFGFGSNPTEVAWFHRPEIRLEREGKNRKGTRIYAKLFLHAVILTTPRLRKSAPGAELEITISPKMFERLDSMLIKSGVSREDSMQR